MFGSASRIEQDTPLPEATGFGTSDTEVTADFDERADMKLFRFELERGSEGCDVRAVAIFAAVWEELELLLLLQSAELELIKGVEVDVATKPKSESGAVELEPETGREVMSSYAGGDADAPAPVNLGLEPMVEGASQAKSDSDKQDWPIA
jgi:hypothetical protein